MIKFFYTILILMIPSIAFTQEWKAFTDTSGKFTAKYPSTWINKIKQGNRVFFTSPADSDGDKFFENINISVTENPEFNSAKVAELFPTVTNGLKKQFSEFKEESLRFFKWNNTDAAEIVYSGTVGNDTSVKVRSKQWYCFYKSRLYIATFVASADQSKHNETANKIMNSIIFKP